jgi:hypothetical protein
MCTPQCPIPDFQRSARGAALSPVLAASINAPLVTPEAGRLFLTGWYVSSYPWLGVMDGSTRIRFSYYAHEEDLEACIVPEVKALVVQAQAVGPLIKIPDMLYDAAGVLVTEPGIVVYWSEFRELVAYRVQTDPSMQRANEDESDGTSQ